MRMLTRILALVAAALILSACEQNAAVEAPLHYSAQNVKFDYPSNWKITRDDTTGPVHQIFVESPGDAIFIATIQPDSAKEALADYAKRFSAAAVAETVKKGFDMTSGSTREMASENSIVEEFSITVVGTTVPHRREFRQIASSSHVAYLVSQSATEDLKQTAPGFAIINRSFALGN